MSYTMKPLPFDPQKIKGFSEQIPRDKRLVNAWAADHTTTFAGGEPVLVLDMYEHAYQMDFGARAADCVTMIMSAIDWSNADRLYSQYSRS
jgi:superoxide dismutase, Fe-Mn family